MCSEGWISAHFTLPGVGAVVRVAAMAHFPLGKFAFLDCLLTLLINSPSFKIKFFPGENYCSVEYSSINDLELQEAKMQHLMELKLKIRLLDVVSKKLSN